MHNTSPRHSWPGGTAAGRHITVIGAVNVDIAGTPAAALISRDSNPGRITVTYGGVGRNIADNSARLGQLVEFITVLGDDPHAGGIRRTCEDQGISLAHSLQIKGRNTSSYLCINDEQGDMQLAINDMAIYDFLTPAFLQDKLDLINQGALLILDANLPAATIEFVAQHTRVPILAEPVSAKKANRLQPVLNRTFLIKPNRLEAEILSGIRIEDDADLDRAAGVLLELGVKNVCISLGGEGVYCASAGYREKIANFPCRVVNTTGCGDAYLAACAWAICHGRELPQAARIGLAAAAICIEAQGPVSPDMNIANVLEKAEMSIN